MDERPTKDVSQNNSATLTNILTSLQQGVIAMNNVTIAIKAIFPSSS